MTMAAPSDRLTISDLTVVYSGARGGLTALASLSMSVKAGEFVSVLGPSGCGKSTLLGIASGLLAPTHGVVQIDGLGVTGPRRDVGIVFQQPTLLPWCTVLGNVLAPIAAVTKPRAEHDERAKALIRLVRLEGFEGHYPHELSGGMQQRVAIARGFMHDPSLLLMDEPFAALDAMTRELMTDELQSLWMRTGKSVLFITHSIPEAVYLSDRVIVLSARPGTVRDVVSIDLPRPRTLETMSSAAFGAICHHLRALFRDTASAGAS